MVGVKLLVSTLQKWGNVLYLEIVVSERIFEQLR